jgi:hypothetical protein
MGSKLILAIIGIFFSLNLTTCAHRWVAYPQDVPGYEKCRLLQNGIQMLKIPGYDLSYMIVPDCFTVRRQKVSIALTVFLEEWGKHHSIVSYQRAQTNINQLLIEFNNDIRKVNAYDHGGNFVKNRMAGGLALTQTVIWVRMEPGDVLCKSSLIHELVHVAIWANKKTDGDPDHLGDRYHGWGSAEELIMKTTNRRLCELGI